MLDIREFSSHRVAQRLTVATFCSGWFNPFNLKSAFAGLEMVHLLKITSAFELSVLSLTVPEVAPTRISKIGGNFKNSGAFEHLHQFHPL
jgi:hypothetical protein